MSAIAIVAPMSVTPEGLLTWLVPSKSEPGKQHRVTRRASGRLECDCTAASFGRDCSHVAAVRLLTTERGETLSITALTRATPVAAEMTEQRPTVLPDPDTWRMMVSMAATLQKSGVLPRHISSPEAAVAIVLQGWELGITPMQALSSIYFLDGKLTISANLMAALIYKRMGNDAFRIVERSAKRCVIEYRRPGWSEPSRIEWTHEMASAAGLLGKDNWKKYTEAMLVARCISAMAHSGFQDVIMGLYTPEELDGPVHVAPDGDVVADAPALPPIQQISVAATPAELSGKAPNPSRERFARATREAIAEGRIATDVFSGIIRDVFHANHSRELSDVAMELIADVAEGKRPYWITPDGDYTLTNDGAAAGSEDETIIDAE